MEDSNPKDELLRRYTKERRQQGGSFELHPATRRLLQAEVAREFQTRELEAGGAKGGFSSWLGLWRGWLALGGATAAALVLAVWMFGPGSEREATMQLARNDTLASESKLMERESLRGGEADKAGAAGQPSAPTLGRGFAFEADQKSVAQLAKFKESPVGAVTTSDSLTPVQNNSVDAGAKTLGDLYAKVPAQKTENYFAAIPGAAPTTWGMQTNPSVTLALNDSGQLRYEDSGVGGPATSFGRTDGSPPLQARYATPSTSGAAVAQNSSPSPSPTLGLQPQVAYSLNAVGLSTVADEPAPRPEVLQSLASSRDVALPTPAENPVTLSRAPAGLASTPAPATAAPSDAFGVDRKLAVASEEQEIRTRVSALSAEARGERMVFFRQSALGLEENLARNARRGGDLVRLQSDTAPEVLSQFTVELNGDAIRVTDVDQSIYEGAISNEVTWAESAAKEGALDETVRAEKRALSTAAAPASGTARNYSFRAVGSNATLKQLVIINGRLSGADELADVANRSSALGGAGPAPAAAPAPTRNRVSSGMAGRDATAIATNGALTIEGTVRVGTTNEQRFRAVRSAR